VAQDEQIVTVSPRTGPGLRKPYYAKESIMKEYEDVIGKVLGSIKPALAQPKTLAAQILEFEKKLAAATPDTEYFLDPQVCVLVTSLILDVTMNMTD